MKFIDENGYYVDTKFFEVTEQKQAEKHIKSDCVVLELGARYGTVSCIINNKLSSRLNQVSVEPDNRVHRVLEINREINNCQFHIVKGFVSRTPLELTDMDAHFGYGTTSYSRQDGCAANCFTLESIEKKYNLKFNTLVADCEGFLEQFFDENPEFYKQITLIIFEKDRPDKCNYDSISSKLKEFGFKCLEEGFNEVWEKSAS